MRGKKKSKKQDGKMTMPTDEPLSDVFWGDGGEYVVAISTFMGPEKVYGPFYTQSVAGAWANDNLEIGTQWRVCKLQIPMDNRKIST
jgi:hypothetical protein